MQQQVESDLRLSDLQSDLTERGSHGLTFHSGGGERAFLILWCETDSIHTNYLSKVAGPIDNNNCQFTAVHLLTSGAEVWVSLFFTLHYFRYFIIRG